MLKDLTVRFDLLQVERDVQITYVDGIGKVSAVTPVSRSSMIRR